MDTTTEEMANPPELDLLTVSATEIRAAVLVGVVGDDTVVTTEQLDEVVRLLRVNHQRRDEAMGRLLRAVWPDNPPRLRRGTRDVEADRG